MSSQTLSNTGQFFTKKAVGDAIDLYFVLKSYIHHWRNVHLRRKK